MTVNELINELSTLNKDANVLVVVNGHVGEFEMCCGGADGSTPETCDEVIFEVGTLNEH